MDSSLGRVGPQGHYWWHRCCLAPFQPPTSSASVAPQALTVSLQGLLHSLVYGWLRQNFRKEVIGEQLPLRCRPDLKAFYDDSLAASTEG